MAKILIFGDSIAWGAVDPEHGGWVGRLRTFLELERNFEIDVYNLGVSGNKTPDLLGRFEFETKMRIKEDEETIIVFAVGINDSYFVHSKNALMTPPEEFKANIQEIIERAQKISPKIIFIGLTPVDETKTTPIPWDTDKSYKNEGVRKYNEIIKSVCKDKNVHFIEIFDGWIKSTYKNWLEDGLHLNSKGHKKIFETVKDFLIKSKIV